ncbi:DUF262 domain-containing protein [Isachenkonia alkalipeptolytica]|uniref:DUF262 domain-containing protein n=1 Tax=Isachenkonia alkalipeptolytica TaxID=2565777 RepID=A0AA43XIY3_9CLOT|nr:DUF262 domain-containing protein [Isachenkonia alkalipeptolytica]NBG87685.1 DUF262 domain-containing protein [Isachenkonia alkalipeptolytica]
MQANETRVEDFLSANKTKYVIPVYQRNYDWTINQCRQLFQDILEVGSRESLDTHFIGSIVYIHDDIYTSSRIKELTIIDGQQRLTTLTLIYVALYKLAIELEDEELKSEVYETYLINKFDQSKEKIKLRATDENDKALTFLLRENKNENFPKYSKVIDNYDFLKASINEKNYQYVLKGLGNLMFVEISLDRDKDNPQRIFESLNSTGLELTQADLIRNYILMGLERTQQKKIYEEYWTVIEEYAKEEKSNTSKVSDFIRDYLTLLNKRIPNKKRVYEEFKLKYPTSSFNVLESSLMKMKQYVSHYNKLINPQNETDKDIKEQLEYIDRLEINVAFPFLLKVYDDYCKKDIDKECFISILELVQTFTWRRFICGLPTNALNKIFMNLSEKVEKNDYLPSIQRAFKVKKGSQRLPGDKEVLESLKVKDVYNIKSKNRIYLLERLENHNNSEKVSILDNNKITVEHIFPQNPDPKWKIKLEPAEYKAVKENYLNTLSNLTLSGNNGKLSNKIFEEKKNLPDYGYGDSRLWLNKDLAKFEKWGINELERRYERLSSRFLEIWKYPDVELDENQENGEVNIFDAEEPRHKKLDYAIFFDQKIETNQVSKLYLEVIRQLFELQPDTFFTTDLSLKIGLTKDAEAMRLREPRKINDNYYIETNIDNNGKFERLKQLLTVFDLEDELVIKYMNEG